MLIPFFFPRALGLRRTGLLSWQSLNDDPYFIVDIHRRSPRYVVFIIEAVEAPLNPVLYLDLGTGFSEELAAGFGPCGRFMCIVGLHQMKQVRRLRLDPSERPDKVRFLALGTGRNATARSIVDWVAKTPNRFGKTRIQTISHADLQADRSGADQRLFRTVAHHYNEVLLQAAATDETVPASADLPVISFLVPTYNTKVSYLDDLLRSFRAQRPGVAELVFGDDGSTSEQTLNWLKQRAAEPDVQILFCAHGGISSATNHALAAARGTWISLLDHDDALSPGAVGQLAGTILRHRDALFIYTDEITATETLKPLHYFLKPAYDPVLLSGVNYINHLSVYRADRLRAIGGLRSAFDGSQDYDLLLRYLDGIDPKRVIHLPYPAYVWRRHPKSFSTEFEGPAVANARRALAERYSREGSSVPVEPALAPNLHRVRFDASTTRWPSVSVIIPNKDAYGLLARCLDGLTNGTDYPDLQIIVVDNGSTDPLVLDLLDRTRNAVPNVVVEIKPEPFNFSRSINRGVSLARGELLLLLNNDIEILDPAWLKEMVSCFTYDDVGIVGARLLYPDRTLQHAGVIVGLGGLAGHWYGRMPETAAGPMARLKVRQSLTAVTGAAMLVSRGCFDDVGPFDEERFAIAYNDIDFCLRARERGYRTVWTPFATLIHHESATRGSDETADKIERFRREQRNLRERHGTDTFEDPAFSPWYGRDRSVPALRALDRLPDAR